jgi:hypothetical protein
MALPYPTVPTGGTRERQKARRRRPPGSGRYITGTDIVVDGGWFSSAPYLINERSHHALSLMDKKDHLEEFLQHFR